MLFCNLLASVEGNRRFVNKTFKLGWPLFLMALWATFGQSAFPQNAAKEPSGVWTPEQMLFVKRVSSVQVSPDGRMVALAVRSAIMEDEISEYRTQIFLANVDGSHQRQITHGSKSADDPQWSPDGKWLSFLSNRNDDTGESSKKNLWLLRTDAVGEAIQLTAMQGDIGNYKWSPNSQLIAFSALDAETAEEKDRKRTKNDPQVVDDNIKHLRLFVVPVLPEPLSRNDLKPYSPSNRSVAGELARAGRAGFDWSPDSTKIVFAHVESPDPDHWRSADLSIVDYPSGLVSSLAQTAAAEASPAFAPDGKSIAFSISDVPPSWAGTRRIAIATLGNSNQQVLPETQDGFGRYSEIVGWTREGDEILFAEMQGVNLRLMSIDRTGKIRPLSKASGMSNSGFNLNASRTHVGFAWENLDVPPEAYCAKLGSFQPVQVSHIQPAIADRKSLTRTDVIRWKSTDDFEIEGLLTYPVGYQTGSRYPLLLVIHGGPMGVFARNFDGTANPYPIATFAEKGYAVLRPNPRGSSGYGKKFRYANYGDWGGGDYRDLMQGVEHLIATGVADPQRLGVMGWSYGGFMTSWIITQTNRFRAASVGAGVTNLVSFTGTADIPSFLPDYFGGEFWDRLDSYRNHSAMFHIKGVTTPTLIQHGERDLRVPLPQGQELYNALKRQGCTTKMIIYPRASHSIEEPKLLLDCMQRNVEWFEKYVQY